MSPTIEQVSPTLAPGQQVEAFHYANGFNYQEVTFNSPESWHTARLPRAYYFSQIPGPAWSVRTVCSLESQPAKPLFWSLPPGQSYSPPTLFHVGQAERNVKGLTWFGAFSEGIAKPPTWWEYAVETVYFTDRKCSDGGWEYGWYKNMVTGRLVFYYSDFTNCAVGYSWKDPEFTLPAPPLVQEIEVTGLQPGSQFLAFVWQVTLKENPNRFEVRVIDRWTCRIHWQSDVIPQPWFPWHEAFGGTGHAIAGIQQQGFSVVPIDEAFYVEGVGVAR